MPFFIENEIRFTITYVGYAKIMFGVNLGFDILEVVQKTEFWLTWWMI